MYRLLIVFILLWGPFSISAPGEIHSPENISFSLYNEYDLSISPDGRYLAFCAESGGDENIYILDLEHRGKKQITFHSASDYAPCFDGDSRILFVSRRENSLGDIYVSDLQGKNMELIIGGSGYFDTPVGSKDRKKIAYVHSAANDSVFIYIFDRKTGISIRGPEGIHPAFFPSGDSLVFATPVGEDKSNNLAVYSLLDSTVAVLETGEGLKLNPVVMNDGTAILYENKSRDSDGDGVISIKDDSDLLIYDINENRIVRYLPGYNFSNPTLSRNNILCARGEDGNFYKLPIYGLSDRESDFIKQNSLCDSLIRYALNYTDSLKAAAVSYESYNYYPADCNSLLIRSALIFSGINKHDLALDISSEIKNSGDPALLSEGILTEAAVRYRAGRRLNNIREKNRAISLCKDLIAGKGVPDSVSRKAYLSCIEMYFQEVTYEEGKALIQQAKNIWEGNNEFLAAIERWELKYLTKTYAGDINDLIPLYIDLMQKFRFYIGIDNLLVADLIELVSSGDPDNALDALEDLKRNYEDLSLLASQASLKQAKILLRENLKSLAEWRLTEIIEKYPDDPELRFEAFLELFNLYLEKAEYTQAAVMIDSISIYMDFINNFALVESFKIKASEYYAFQGLRALDKNPEQARLDFHKSLKNNRGNANALWGLAESIYSGKSRDEEDPARLLERWQYRYLMALKDLYHYVNTGNISNLKTARNKLIDVIEEYPSYPPPYLSVGFADCLLEDNSESPLGLFEEAVEYSLKGVALAGRDKNLEYAFYANLAEAYFGLSQFEEAYKYYSLLLSGIPAYEDSSGFIIKYGECAFHIDSLDIAEKYFEKLYGISKKSGDEKSKSLSAIKLGLINQSRENYIEAAEYYEIAKTYYYAEKDFKTVGDLLKAQGFCLKMTGDEKAALPYADEALKLFNKYGYRGAKYDHRIKFILWPFGISIPLIELLPMRFGGSLYPAGFTSAANEAFLKELNSEGKEISAKLNLKNDQIRILDDAGEEENSVDLWDEVGSEYFKIGYGDSAAVAFNKAYKLCMNLEDYHGAYIELLNWAEAVLGVRSNSPEYLKILEEVGKKALDLYDYILPSYPNARANLKNIAGLVEYNKGISALSDFTFETAPDFQTFISTLDETSNKSYSYFQKAKFYFREALSELVPGEYPGLETGLLLNDAVVSYSTGDLDNVAISVRNAEKSAILSGSPRLYAMVIGFGALAGLGDPDKSIEILIDALKIYENLPVGEGPGADISYLGILYDKIIRYYINKGDFQSALYYLELSKKLRMVTGLSRINTIIYKTDYFRANIGLLNRYQRELVDLELEKKRVQSMRSISQSRINNLNESILQKRGRLLELREETREIDPVAYSSLVFDVPSVISLVGRIPENEACVIPYESDEGMVLWICVRDSINFLGPVNLDDRNDLRLVNVIVGRDIINVVSSDGIYDLFTKYFENLNPGVAVKRALSLDHAYPGDIGNLRRTDRILIIKFKGSVLSDSFAREIGADVVYYDSKFKNTDISQYGWIIFDGELYVDEDNFLYSHWEEVTDNPGEATVSNYRIYELPKLQNEASGMILIDATGALGDRNSGILLKIIENMGIQTIITVSDIKDGDSFEENLRKFTALLDVNSPLISYGSVFGLTAGSNTPGDDSRVSYYGENGWSKADEGPRIENLYNEYLVIGNQYFIQSNWQMARKYYYQALKLIENRKLAHISSAHVVRKLLQTYEKMDNYASLIQRDAADFIEVLSEAGDSVYLAKIYRDMAGIKYDEYDLMESIRYASSLIDISSVSGDISSLAEGYSIRGKSYFDGGELERAASDLAESFRLYTQIEKTGEAHSSMLHLTEVYHVRGLYGRSKTALDSLENLIKEDMQSENYFYYMIQLSKYYMATFRNELAKKQLELLRKTDKSDPELSIMLGRIYLRRGNTDSALVFGRNGLTMVAAQKEKYMLKEAHELLGDIYRMKDMNDEAASHYNLAYEAVKDFQYTPIIDLIKYKRALAEEINAKFRDSLYSEIVAESSSEFVRDICIYQFGYRAIENKDYATAKVHFDRILSSNDIYTSRYLKWRAYYYLARTAEETIRREYLEKAEIICGNYPGEPDYIKRDYGFNEERADLYFSLADLFLKDGQVDVAVNYMETAYSARVSGRHFAIGNFDETESLLLNNIFGNPAEAAISEAGNNVPDTIIGDKKYRVLWGKAASSVENLKSAIDENKAVLRFFRIDSSYTGIYLDADTVKVIRYKFSENDLRNTLSRLGDLTANQSKSDSVLEKWYMEIIAPVEDLLLAREEVILVPDGLLYLMPLEALKMPEADYLSEMFAVKRNISLPREFPGDIGRNRSAVPAVETSLNPDIRLVQYIAEPFAAQSPDPDYTVRFYSGDFSFFDKLSAPYNGIVCVVRTVDEKNLSDLVLQAFLSLRSGNYGFAYPLWEMSDELKSTYYWKLLKNLSEGSGFWNSWNFSRSYLFGHFEGLPYFWGSNIYSRLN